ncbi:MAG: nuclear transport factor 2 family protein [Thermoanaerobaculia bacterium]|jgi:ketosteroid isomerase-like protein
MKLWRSITIAALLGLSVLTASAETNAELREQVRATETAFAKTMADRDHAKFTSFLADETIFFGSKSVMRGKSAVAEAWKRFFEGPKPPFAWAPEKVEVLDSGTLAMSSGPVTDPETGARVSTFNSTWRRDKDGSWKIVLDIGCPQCECGE